jgi:hypothetical protein
MPLAGRDLENDLWVAHQVDAAWPDAPSPCRSSHAARTPSWSLREKRLDLSR